MLTIETVTLASGQRLPQTVANTKDHQDLDCFRQETKDYDTDILYNAQSKQTVPRPAATIEGDDAVLFTVRVRVPQELQGQPIQLSTDNAGSTWYSSYDFGTGLDPDIVAFNMMRIYHNGANYMNPQSLLGPTQFYLQLSV